MLNHRCPILVSNHRCPTVVSNFRAYTPALTKEKREWIISRTMDVGGLYNAPIDIDLGWKGGNEGLMRKEK